MLNSSHSLILVLALSLLLSIFLAFPDNASPPPPREMVAGISLSPFSLFTVSLRNPLWPHFPLFLSSLSHFVTLPASLSPVSLFTFSLRRPHFPPSLSSLSHFATDRPHFLPFLSSVSLSNGHLTSAFFLFPLHV